MRSTRPVPTVLMTAFALAAAHAHAQGFSGVYAPAHFTLTNLNANGFANAASAPNSIALTGGNNGDFLAGFTSYTTVAAMDSDISFQWAYHSNDSGRTLGNSSFYDPAGYLIGVVPIQLTALLGSVNQSGTASFHVSQGQSFGFYVGTTDNRKGASTLTLSDFKVGGTNVAAVPEPGTVALLIGMGVCGVGTLARRNRLRTAR